MLPSSCIRRLQHLAVQSAQSVHLWTLQVFWEIVLTLDVPGSIDVVLLHTVYSDGDTHVHDVFVAGKGWAMESSSSGTPKLPWPRNIRVAWQVQLNLLSILCKQY